MERLKLKDGVECLSYILMNKKCKAACQSHFPQIAVTKNEVQGRGYGAGHWKGGQGPDHRVQYAIFKSLALIL